MSQEEIVEFFRQHTAYDTMPESGKVIVLDVDLSLQAAFRADCRRYACRITRPDFALAITSCLTCFNTHSLRALVSNEVSLAALYDAKAREHCGVLTPLELAHAIARFHRDQGGNTGQSEVIERLMLGMTLREELASNPTHATTKQLETTPEQNLFEICQMLHERSSGSRHALVRAE